MLPFFVLNLLRKYKKSSLLIIILSFSMQLLSQRSVIDTSLARRIKEKEEITKKNKNFIPGTLISKVASGLPEQDCNGAISVCQYVYYTAISYSGFGNVSEIPSGSTCLGLNELNSVWYTFSTSSPGNLAFNIAPNTLTDDYDFALYDITGNNCSGILNGSILPIRCNFAAQNGVTGLSNSGSSNQSPILATSSGKTYVLIISNFSSTQSGYTIDFSPSTASIFDNVSPTIQTVVAPCGSSSITINTSEQVTCNSIAANGSDFTLSGSGGPYTVSSATGINCGINSGQLTLSISPVLTGAGPWTLAIVSGSDGNTLMDGCGNPMATSSTTFALAPAVIAVSGITAICSGGTATLTASGVTTYTWSTGVNTTTIVVTPTATTVYTVTGTVSGLGCSAIGTKTVNVYTNSVSASPVTQTICQGSSASIFAAGAQSYTWSPGTSSSDPSFIAYPSTSTTYTLKGANTCGTYSTTAVVNVTPISGTITITPSVGICSGNSATISATGGTSYTWTPSTALSSTNTAVVVASPTSSTTYSVILKNASGCTRTYEQPVTIYNNNIGISPVTQTICQGSSAFISASGAQTYTWNTGSTFNSISVSPNVNTTYSLSGANTCGTFTNSAIVYVTPISGTITSAPSFSICKGSSTTLTATGGTSYTWTPSTALSATNSAVVVASPTTSAVYYLTMTNASGCLRSYAKPITVYTNSISISSSTLTICQGATLTLTGTGAQTYTWNTGATTSSISVTPTVSTTYSLIGTNPCGTFTTSVNVTVNPITGTITSAPSFSICKGSSTTLTASGGTSYTWSPSTALSSTNTAATVASPTISTTYSMTLMNASGCSRTYTKTISVYTNSLNISASPAFSLCAGNSISLIGSGAQTYTWSPGGVASSISISPTTNTSYTLTGTNVCGTYSTAATVTVSSAPSVSVVSSAASLCLGGTTTLTASGGTSYTWSPSATLSNSVGVSVTAFPSATTVYSVTTSANAFGCSGPIATTTITVGNGVVFDSISVSQNNICAGLPSVLKAYASNPIVTYCQPIYSIGTSGGDYISKVILGTLNNTSAGLAAPYYTVYPQAIATTTLIAGNTYSLNLTAGTYLSHDLAAWIDYNQNGSLSDAGEKLGEVDNLAAIPASTIIVFTVPLTAVNGKVRFRVREMDHATTNDMDPCAAQSSYGETEDYNITISGGVNPTFTYSWSPSTFLSSTTTMSTTSNATLTTAYTVTVSNAFGCSASGVKTLTIIPAPVISVTGNTSICAGQTTTLTLNGGSSYTWSPASSLSTITNSIAVASPSSSITYSVTGSNSFGCTKTNTVFVNVSPDYILNTSVSQSTICTGSNSILSATGASSYSWMPSSSLSSSTGATVSANPISSTIYTTTSTNSNGCIKTNTVLINVSPDYTLSISASQPTICLGSSSILSVIGGLSYTWSPSITLSSSSGASVSANPTTSVIYTVTSVNANGCVKIQTQNLDVSDFTINVSNTSSQSCINSPIALLVTTNPLGSYSYSWSPNSLLNAANIYNPQLTSTVAVNDTYAVLVTNSIGCSKTGSVYVQIIDCGGAGTGTVNIIGGIKIYSGVSPNGDNHNDTWIIDGIEGEPNNDIIILNKWGQEVWKTDGYNNVDKVWKGTNQSGEALTDGTYYYILKTSSETYKGRVELIR